MKFNAYYFTQGMLLFIFSRYSWHDWLIDGRSLIKTKLNRLINSVCFVWLSAIKKGKAKNGNYSAKYTERSTVHDTWKYTVKSTVHGTWEQCGNTVSYVTALWTFDIVKGDISFLLYRFTNISFCRKSTWLAFKICWTRVARKFLLIILIWFF